MSETIRSPDEKRYPVTRIGSSMEGELLPALARLGCDEALLQAPGRGRARCASRRHACRIDRRDAARLAGARDRERARAGDAVTGARGAALVPEVERCPRCAWLPDAIIAKTLPSPRATVRKPYQVLSEPESARLLAAA